MSIPIRKKLSVFYSKETGLSFFDRAFIRARMWMLPLEELDRIVPRDGTIVEIGCGHGIITNYLGLASSARKIIGVDIDSKRISIARQPMSGKENVEYFLGEIQDASCGNVDMVVLFGVLLLIPFQQWKGLFKVIRAVLKPGGVVLLHDVKKADTAIFRLHKAKEWLLHITGITKGAGFFVLEPEALQSFLREAGFSIVDLGKQLDVPGHSCFSYLLKKNES